MFSDKPKEREPEDLAIPNAERFEFQERFDADGLRKVVIIGNEREGGCPFHCVGCGVHEQAHIVSAEENNQEIQNVLRNLVGEQNRGQSREFHMCVYNEGNVTNKEELSRENLHSLLNGLAGLEYPPTYVSLNSRAAFINKELLEELNGLNLPLDIHFIIGAETLSKRGGDIYGKKNIAQELEKVFKILREANARPDQKRPFCIDAGFVFLPEFYLKEGETRNDREAVRRGFAADIKSFIDKYVGKGVPTKINLHPYYPVPTLPYKSSSDLFSEFMMGVADLLPELRQINDRAESKQDRISLFIGMQGTDYETEEWRDVLSSWGDTINRVNALSDYKPENCDKIRIEIENISKK